MRLQTLREARLHNTHPFVNQLEKLVAKFRATDDHFVERYYEVPPEEAGEVITNLYGRYAGTIHAAHGQRMVKWKPRGLDYAVYLDPSEDTGVWITIEDRNLENIQEARYNAPERWIHEDRVHDLIQAVCFNGYGSVSDFWEIYHRELIPLDNMDPDYAYSFMSDLSFKRKQHVRSMNATLEQWSAPFRVRDMRWIGEDDDAPIEWKVVGKIPEKA